MRPERRSPRKVIRIATSRLSRHETSSAPLGALSELSVPTLYQPATRHARNSLFMIARAVSMKHPERQCQKNCLVPHGVFGVSVLSVLHLCFARVCLC